MLATTTELPLWDILFAEQQHRLVGVESWEDIAVLGTANITCLIRFAQENVNRMMASGVSRSELRLMAAGIAALRGHLVSSLPKPLLPRLRVESFHKGEEVVIYVGDSEGSVAPTDWVNGVLMAVRKDHRPEWGDGSPNGGYFWRWTAALSVPAFPGQSTLEFSTSEPRVIPATDFTFLRTVGDKDRRFLEIFAASANRSWVPLWCLERGTGIIHEAMDMKSWILTGSYQERR